MNVPFAGKVAYNTREYSYDNAVTELIRHTIEYIDRHPYGKGVLDNDKDTIEAVNIIRMATPANSSNELRLIIGKNIRPVNHPYFTEYRPLQQLCLRILRHEEMKYGKDDDEIYGILFDGAWLWEEYLDTILSECRFNHPHNKTGEGGIQVFEDNREQFYPDFWQENFVLDAKYKGYENLSVQSKDYHQIIAYMHILQAEHGGFIVPFKREQTQEWRNYKLRNVGGEISVYGLYVGIPCKSYSDYVRAMEKEENELKRIIGITWRKS